MVPFRSVGFVPIVITFLPSTYGVSIVDVVVGIIDEGIPRLMWQSAGDVIG